MKLWKLVVPFTFAAGIGTGAALKDVYDSWTAPSPLETGDRFTAAITEVYDADTFTLVRGAQTHKARLWGIDAPERSQRCRKGARIEPCGLMARDAFRKLVLDRSVSCEVKGFDNNRDRPVVRCTLDGNDPVASLVRDGWALSDKVYAADPYRGEQEEARSKKRGLWAMEMREPARWRACQALGRGGAGAVPDDCLKPLGPLGR